MKRTDIINILIKKYNFKSYLEIGVADGINFSLINCEHKVGVDCDTNITATYCMTSDEYFAYAGTHALTPNDNHKVDLSKPLKRTIEKFDIIFIDGLHTKEQALKDVINSTKVLTENGIIVMHDCNPPNEYIARETNNFDNLAPWTGDVWKAFINLEEGKFVVDCDYGVGVISFSALTKIGNPQLIYDITFEEFKKNNKQYLNLISEQEFLKRYL